MPVNGRQLELVEKAKKSSVRHLFINFGMRIQQTDVTNSVTLP